ncbi:MSMEG_1061 family FMN-dependent PPOX-type flavoprotein [Novispirillum itersonii]|uniref:Pyridoxamine 5'-phosphate oxidase N-terminal domain-containing protein n=1 Tax=Novispirillum itersonii TaxID=189 RepID=A0A7X0DPW7_NOVIT|nr:MSMEG_1061 family FMN-dependent PPOX-type flavoprotein [Novispirillum itersonii]MBB6211712.1 hypothetical protein [Novispirillum itersonii]
MMTQPDTFPDLDSLYPPPSEAIQRAVLPHLIAFHRTYLEAATFFCLATGGADGLDASPRGGAPGFVKVLDDRTVAFADWPGNNRIESLRNLRQESRVALLFLFPGQLTFLRINGQARASTDAALLERLQEGGKTPKLGIVVQVDQVLFHCGKAISRARLWDPASQELTQDLPGIGQMKTALMGGDPSEAGAVEAQYRHAVTHDLY